MGSTTRFEGRFNLDKPLAEEHRAFLAALHGYKEEALAFFEPGQRSPPYCQWRVTADGLGIEWDGAQKFYGYVDWIKAVQSKLSEWGYSLTGSVAFEGEDLFDVGVIVATPDGIVVSRHPGVPWSEIPERERREVLAAIRGSNTHTLPRRAIRAAFEALGADAQDMGGGEIAAYGYWL